MYCLCDKFLSDTAFSLDKHTGFRAGDETHLVDHMLDSR
jgi:hypothetical protein